MVTYRLKVPMYLPLKIENLQESWGDKTMDDKFIISLMMINKITTSLVRNSRMISFDSTSLKLINQIYKNTQSF